MKIAPVIATCLVLAGCARQEKGPVAIPRGGENICTSFYPSTYFATRIAGSAVPVECLLPDDADPIFWQPARDAIEAYQGAGLIVLNGAAFEKWVETASLPRSRTVELSAPFAEQWLRYEDTVLHRHGPEGEHSHDGIDGHCWLDPVLAKIQATELLRAMQDHFPEHAAAFAAGHAGLAAELDALHAQLQELSPPPLLASHPAFNYVAHRYQWDIASLDFDPGEMPGEAQLRTLREALAGRPVKILLWESEPLPAIALKLRTDFGLHSVVFSPCESAPPTGDYISAMKDNVARLAASIGENQ